MPVLAFYNVNWLFEWQLIIGYDNENDILEYKKGVDDYKVNRPLSSRQTKKQKYSVELDSTLLRSRVEFFTLRARDEIPSVSYNEAAVGNAVYCRKLCSFQLRL